MRKTPSRINMTLVLVAFMLSTVAIVAIVYNRGFSAELSGSQVEVRTVPTTNPTNR